MMKFPMPVRMARSASASLEKLPPAAQERLASAIDRLGKEGLGDILKLTGRTNEYRLRVGAYRIVFQIEGQTIFIYALKDRKDAYR
jgi:mRNA interferase RelE/StbE